MYKGMKLQCVMIFCASDTETDRQHSSPLGKFITEQRQHRDKQFCMQLKTARGVFMFVCVRPKRGQDYTTYTNTHSKSKSNLNVKRLADWQTPTSKHTWEQLLPFG